MKPVTGGFMQSKIVRFIFIGIVFSLSVQAEEKCYNRAQDAMSDQAIAKVIKSKLSGNYKALFKTWQSGDGDRYTFSEQSGGQMYGAKGSMKIAAKVCSNGDQIYLQAGFIKKHLNIISSRAIQLGGETYKVASNFRSTASASSSEGIR